MAEPTLTPAVLLQEGACALGTRLAELTEALEAMPSDDAAIPLSVWWDLPSTALGDRWWTLRCLGRTEVAGGLLAAVEACRRAALTLGPQHPRLIDLEEAWECVEDVARGRHLGFDVLQIERAAFLEAAGVRSCTHSAMAAELLAAGAHYLKGNHHRAATRLWSVYSLGLYIVGKGTPSYEAEVLSQVLDLEAYVLRGER